VRFEHRQHVSNALHLDDDEIFDDEVHELVACIG